MEISSLEPALEPVFWKYVNQDIPHFFFYAYDWKYYRKDTEILLALRENEIEAMMLVYDKRVVQLRGNQQAVGKLLERLDLEKIELQALDQHRKLVLQEYEPTVSHDMMLMLLHKGQEKPLITHSMSRLGTHDSEHVAAIMREADPEYWGTVTKQQIAEGMSSRIWVGVKVDGQLLSIGSARLTEWTGLIGVIATDSSHRNKGYATSITSELTEHILAESSVAMIYVLKDNPSAVRVYEKVGFKPYKTYFFMRGERR